MAKLNLRRTQVHQFKETARVDPYRSQSKHKGTPRCPECASVAIQGRWIPARLAKKEKPTVLVTSEVKCPACVQLEDHFALGVVELRGPHWKQQLELVNSTIQRTEKIARYRNDQERILWTGNRGGLTKIYVTLPELARRIGRQLEKTFKGKTEYQHSPEEPYLRVIWHSDQSRLRLVPSDSHKSKAFRGRGDGKP